MDQLVDARDQPSPADPALVRARVAALARGATIEISARDRAADGVCRDLLAPGTPVYITHAPSDTTPGMVVAAARLRRAGRKVRVSLPGGDLIIEWRASDDHVLMTGPVEYEHNGRFNAALAAAGAA